MTNEAKHTPETDATQAIVGAKARNTATWQLCKKLERQRNILMAENKELWIAHRVLKAACAELEKP